MLAPTRRITWLGLAASSLLAFAIVHGCGSDSEDTTTKKDAGNDSAQGGTAGGSAGTGNGGTAGVSPNCSPVGTTCAANSDCCTANCDPTLNACANPVGSCGGPGSACTVATECCTLVCSGGQCGSNLCTSDAQACTSDAECCSGTCGGTDAGSSTCTPLNSSCKTAGNSCGANTDCCSKLCKNGNCAIQSSFCSQTGDLCGADAECCTGICNKASGSTVGTCKQPDAPGTTGCLIAGEVCGAGANGDGGTAVTDAGVPVCGGECCSRSCAPYGPTGVLVCQPPSGCHPTGEVCVTDSDCCGAPGVPGGNGSVKCSKSAGEPTGRCDNGQACRPAGAVCKLATTSCNAENNCCAGNVNQDPRCASRISSGSLAAPESAIAPKRDRKQVSPVPRARIAAACPACRTRTQPMAVPRSSAEPAASHREARARLTRIAVPDCPVRRPRDPPKASAARPTFPTLEPVVAAEPEAPAHSTARSARRAQTAATTFRAPTATACTPSDDHERHPLAPHRRRVPARGRSTGLRLWRRRLGRRKPELHRSALRPFLSRWLP